MSQVDVLIILEKISQIPVAKTELFPFINYAPVFIVLAFFSWGGTIIYVIDTTQGKFTLMYLFISLGTLAVFLFLMGLLMCKNTVYADLSLIERENRILEFLRVMNADYEPRNVRWTLRDDHRYLYLELDYMACVID